MRVDVTELHHKQAKVPIAWPFSVELNTFRGRGTNVAGRIDLLLKMSSDIPTEEQKERFMTRAIELSEEGASKGHGGPYGCVIVKDGEIVGQ